MGGARIRQGYGTSPHEPFISTYRRHADIVTQTDSLFLDHRWDVQKALQGHGPDIKADTVAGQMDNTTGMMRRQSQRLQAYILAAGLRCR